MNFWVIIYVINIIRGEKMKKKNVFTVLILALIAFSMYRGYEHFNSNKEPVTRTNYIMGTIVNLTLFGSGNDEAFEGSFELIRDIESKMSLNIEDSEISEINRNAGVAPVKVSQDTFDVIEKSIEYSELSEGKFDISSGAIVQLWNIGSDSARVPAKSELDDALNKVGFEGIVLDKSSQTVFLKQEGMVLDLGAIAKGFAADKVRDYLFSEGITKGIVDIGGNLYLIGTNRDDEAWTVGIQNPFSENRNEYLGSISETNKSVVTSGVYERYFEEGGVRYHHILDTSTGYPVDNDLMSVSIVSDESIDGDALSTSAFALGLEKGMALIESLDGVDAIFVTKDKKVYLSKNIKGNFKIHDPQFKTAE